MKLFTISCVVLFLAACSSVQVHPITCSNIDKCYESAYVKCRGHWTQISKYDDVRPANYKDGEYTLNVLCKR